MTDAGKTDFDVVILGAGVNGAGLFRDLCEQGLRCLIVDKGDFGSGTSAAPSRLIHGGLKYLETGEFRLVAESTHERNLLLRNAPHLVHPLLVMMPIYSWTKGIGAAIRTFFGARSAPRSRGRLLVSLGLWLYDLYGSRARVMPRHRMMDRAAALGTMPSLTPAIVAAGTYYDAVITAPERLVLELIKDGLRASPASKAMNWTTLAKEGDGTLVLTPPEGEAVRCLPKVVINSAGPWIDHVNAALGHPTRHIGGTKGSHILLDHDALLRELDGRMLYFERDDGRICLVFPYHGRALAGSTDIPADNPDEVACDENEITYFLDALRTLLPGLAFSEEQIVYAYAGIRPLPNSEGTEPGMISRDHSSPTLAPEAGRPYPVISLIGGKWTTFRAFSEEVSLKVTKLLGLPHPHSTRDEAIGGGRDFPETPKARRFWIETAARLSGAAPERLEILLDRYGTTATEVATHEAAQSGSQPIVPGSDFTEAEIDWIARGEMVVHLEDIALRRTQLAITGRLSAAALERMAAVAAAALGWDAGRISREIAATRAVLETRHHVRLT